MHFIKNARDHIQLYFWIILKLDKYSKLNKTLAVGNAGGYCQPTLKSPWNSTPLDETRPNSMPLKFLMANICLLSFKKKMDIEYLGNYYICEKNVATH